VSRVSRNIIANLLGQIFLVFAGFLATRYVFRELGPDAVGLIYFVQTLTTTFSTVLELGLSSVTIRQVAVHADRDRPYVTLLLQTGGAIYWTAYSAAAVAIWFLAPVLTSHWLVLTSVAPSQAAVTLRILGIASLTMLPRSLYASAFRGVQRSHVPNAIDVVTVALQQVGAVVILSLHGTLLQVTSWLAACSVAGVTAAAWWVARTFGARAIVPRWNTDVARRNFAYARGVASTSLVAMLNSQADKLILSKWLSIGSVGFYNVAYSIAARGAVLAGAVAQAILPYLATLTADEDPRLLQTEFLKFQEFIVLATGVSCAAIIFAAVPVLTFTFNLDTARMLLLPVTYLAIGFYLCGILGAPYVLSLSAGHPEIFLRSNLFAIAAVLPVTTALIAKFGLSGAAASWAYYNLFMLWYTVPRVCRTCLRMTSVPWLSAVVTVGIVPVVAYSAAWEGAALLGGSLPALVFAYAIGSIACAAGGYILAGEHLKGALTAILKSALTGSMRRQREESEPVR
jgi:O-antigen/teichoic acid export membrane protein